MNRYLPIALVALCAGCVHTTHIISATIAEANDKEIKLSVVTDEDVLKYDNSHWAYEVHLVYSVNDNKYFNNIGTDTKIDSAPFLAERVSAKSIPHKHGWYETIWSIQSSNSTSVSGRTYFYDLSENRVNLIKIEFSGGTMHLTGLRSDNFVVQYPETK